MTRHNENRLWIEKMDLFTGGTPTCETCVYWEERGRGFLSSTTNVCTNNRSPENGKEKGKNASCNNHESK